MWTRAASPDVRHKVEWQKEKWTGSETVRFFVNLSATWTTGPDVSWPDATEPLPALVLFDRLRLPVDDAMAVPSGRQPSTVVLGLSGEVTDDDAAATVLRLLAEQGRPTLDRVRTPADCVALLREPDASIPGAETLMRHFAAAGDRDEAQRQYHRLRRHFGHRDLPRDPRLRALVAELGLTEPPSS